jgi:PAS domain S-box-containing protein
MILRRLRWYHVHYLLAAVTLLVLAYIVILTDHIFDTYVDSLEANRQWTQRAAAYSELTELATQVNAPGNEVFPSGDVAAESKRLAAAIARYRNHSRTIRDDVHSHVDRRAAAEILELLRSIDSEVEGMRTAASRVFDHVSRRQVTEAGREMAAMDRHHSRAISVSMDLHRIVHRHVGEQLANDTRQAKRLERIQNLVAVFVVVIIAAATVYVFSLARQMNAGETELYRFRAALDCSADAVFLVERSTLRFVDMNRTACEQLGYSRDELLSLGPADIVCEYTVAKLQSDCAAILDMPDKTGKFEQAIVRKDGSTFPVEVFVTAIEDSSELFVASVHDVTKRKQNEDTMRALNVRLQQKQRLETVGTLAGGIAHEFNNLLQTIRGYTGFAMKGLDAGAQRHKDLEEVIKATARAANLTQQMLGFGRQKAAVLENISPNELVEELVKLLRPLVGATIAVTMMIDDQAGTLDADRTLIQQMLMNLCVNARDAMPDGGELTIRTRNVVLNDARSVPHPDARPGRFVQFSVSDSGVGMSADVVERIFEPFFTTKEVGKGTGLGLSLAYGIVKQHDGFIYAYSEPRRGTVFKVYLPVVEGAADEAAGRIADEVPGGTETILVAEDDPAVRAVTVRALTDAGYRVLIANDGHEAVELVERRTEDIALILLDVVMPRLGGHEARRAIRRTLPDVPIVFCTGYDPETATGFQLHEDRGLMLEKPIDPDTLLRVVRATLDKEVPCLAT